MIVLLQSMCYTPPSAGMQGTLPRTEVDSLCLVPLSYPRTPRLSFATRLSHGEYGVDSSSPISPPRGILGCKDVHRGKGKVITQLLLSPADTRAVF
jgi:hypothetical protein